MMSKPAKAGWNFIYILVIIGIGYSVFMSKMQQQNGDKGTLE